MENASKALIIAGAILISVLIITLGVMVYQNVSGIVKENTDMSQFEITSFNEKFSGFFGNNQRGSNVNSLINTVRVHNNSQDDESKKISIKLDGKECDNTTKAATGKTYKVEATEYTTAGLISTITITTNTK